MGKHKLPYLVTYLLVKLPLTQFCLMLISDYWSSVDSISNSSVSSWAVWQVG